MNISSGATAILANGTVFTYKTQPTTFNLDPQLQLTFYFSDDEVNKISRLESAVINPYHAQLTFVNFNDPIGQGFNEALKVGDINGRDVMMFVWITKLNTAIPTKKIEYTFFNL